MLPLFWIWQTDSKNLFDLFAVAFIGHLGVLCLAAALAIKQLNLRISLSARQIKRVGLFARSLLGFGLPNFAHSVMTMLIVTSPRYLMATHVGVVEAGVYALAFGIASKLQSIANAFCEVLYPYISGSKLTNTLTTQLFAVSVLSFLVCLVARYTFDFFPRFGLGFMGWRKIRRGIRRIASLDGDSIRYFKRRCIFLLFC